MSEDPVHKGEWFAIGLALLGVTALRLRVAGGLGLSADEAYYWCWSQALAWGYYDHPPAIAGLIAAGTALLGDTELGVRAAGVGLQALLVAGLVWHERASALLCVLLLGAPLLSLGGILATPDTPLVLAWGLGLVAAERRRWGLLGLACGLAMLSKHTGVLLWPAVWLASDKRQPGLYAAAALGALILSPNLVWNAQHDWVSFAFQLDHGLSPEAEPPGLAGLLGFWGAQLGLLGPVLGVAGLVWLLRGPRDQALIWWSAALPLGVVSAASLVGHAEANWAAPAWLGVLMGLARARGALERAAWVGAWTGAGLSLLVVAHSQRPLIGLDPDPVDELYEGAFIGQTAAAWGAEPVLTSRYQEAAWIRFYGGVDATTVPDIGRRDQFDLWPRALPASTIFVRPARRSEALGSDAIYPEVGQRSGVLARRGERVIAAWQVVPVSGYAPGRE
ncbi:MAG: glycosyltransferase family 39 protein [Alphaproteobacteria bacterium]|nr:glycosyltransferase family 39 protein [Alphaproteobacteria bacterium]